MKSLEALALLAALAAPGQVSAEEQNRYEVVRVSIHEERCRGRTCVVNRLLDEHVEIRFDREGAHFERVFAGAWGTTVAGYRVAVRIAGEATGEQSPMTNKKYFVYIYTAESERAVGEVSSPAPLKNLLLIGNPVPTAEGGSSSLRVELSSMRKDGGGDPFPGCTGCTFW